MLVLYRSQIDPAEAQAKLTAVYEAAKQRCIARGEGWRWGVGVRPTPIR
jgi:hypothetical protein